MRKNLCWNYFLKSIFFIVEQFRNEIIDPENVNTRKIKFLKKFLRYFKLTCEIYA